MNPYQPTDIPRAVANHYQGHSSPDKPSLYKYVSYAEKCMKALKAGFISVEAYEADRTRQLEKFYRDKLGCKN